MEYKAKKVALWILMAVIWLFAIGVAYLGLIMVILGPDLPRSDIDYVVGTTSQERAKDIEAALNFIEGLLALAVSATMIWFSKKVYRFLLEDEVNKTWQSK